MDRPETGATAESTGDPVGRRSSVALGERDEIAAALEGRVDERAWCCGAKLETVAGVELVLGVALAEAQVSLKHPDLLVDEGVGVGRVGDFGARGQLYFDDGLTTTGPNLRQAVECTVTNRGVALRFGQREGAWRPWWKQIAVTVHGPRPVRMLIPDQAGAATIPIR